MTKKYKKQIDEFDGILGELYNFDWSKTMPFALSDFPHKPEQMMQLYFKATCIKIFKTLDEIKERLIASH